DYVQAGLSAVMTAHVLFDEVESGIPATMSRRVVHGLLREELGFDGVVVSDDIEMKAIADHYALEEVVVQGVLAGVDLFLVCHRSEVQQQAIEALVRAVESGRVSRERIEASHRRLARLESRFTYPSRGRLASLGTAEHRALAEGLSSTFSGEDPTEALS
ncbi:MAG TPA: glycoside hydrolase family 3 N-terminal domain-containing protein, partial [Myxococcaceae bacterium]|nr:glycoside hydrolase family 3 N-terminal domain-containing protein [Myxococcaceae bacterium]